MTDDIVERLREVADAYGGEEGDLYLDAAHGIENLREVVAFLRGRADDHVSELERLRAALVEIGNAKRFGVTPQTELAQQALQGSE